MEPIPMPEVLDPGRVLGDSRQDMGLEAHRARAQLLNAALQETCAYGTKLWTDLNTVRRYLMNSLPADPATPGNRMVVGASPTGPDDDAGWNNWIDAYAAVTSALAGPRGDSGHGLSEARQAAQLRRTRIRAAPAAGDQLTGSRSQPSTARAQAVRALATAAFALVALRSLRPRTKQRPAAQLTD